MPRQICIMVGDFYFFLILQNNGNTSNKNHGVSTLADVVKQMVVCCFKYIYLYMVMH